MIRRMKIRSLPLLAALASTCMVGTAQAELSIKRDNYGVPAIRATTNSEMFFGAGYAMARDRINQITTLRSMSLGMLPKEVKSAYNVFMRSSYPNLDKEMENEIANIKDFDKSVPGIAANCMAEGINQFLADISSNGGDKAVQGKCYSGSLKKDGSQLSFGEKLGPEELGAIKSSLAKLQPNSSWTGLDIIRIFQNRVMDVFSADNNQLLSLAYLKLLEQANPGNLKRARRIFNSTKWIADPNATTEIPVPEGLTGEKMRSEIAAYRDKVHGELLEAGPSDICKIYSSPDNFANKVRGKIETQLAATEGHPLNASNFWAETGEAVDPEFKSLMLNGPQAGAIDPSHFYPLNMASKEGFKYAGTTFSGTFFPSFGHNDVLAYGLTAANNGSTDIFCVDVTKQDDGSYKSDNGLVLSKNPELAAIGVSGFYVEGKNWPVKLLDKNTDGSKAMAFIKRHSWQGQVVSSFGASIQASQATSVKDWNTALDRAAGNFNIVSAHKSGKIAFRLTGIIPPRMGTDTDPNTDPMKASNYLPSFDLRLPVPMSPTEGWRSDNLKYYKLGYSTDNGRIISWNHKPYLLMPDSDMVYASWIKWDRSLYISEALQGQKSTLKSTAATNGVLSLKQVYFGQFKQFLAKLPSIKLNEIQQKTLDKILAWNGYRDDASTLKDYNEERLVNGGEVLFQAWMKRFADRFQGAILQNGSSALSSLWGKGYAKLKQPKLRTIPEKPSPTFNTSSNIHLIGRMMLKDLHRVFNGVENADPNGFSFLANRAAVNAGPDEATQELALTMMAAALEDASKDFTTTYGNYADKNGDLPSRFRSVYGVSKKMSEGPFTSSRNPILTAPYFRNRGAQNHIVGFDVEGKAHAYNEVPGGVREYSDGKALESDDQMFLLRYNDFRAMIDLSLGIGETPEDEPTLTKRPIKSKL